MIEKLKEDICEIGRRVYAKNYVAANEGNISVRLDDEKVLCTPTLCCKGFMNPADICTVDMDGNQLAGERKRTSEVLLHLEIYKQRPDVKSIVHAHPPHATAFAVAHEPIPHGVLPEPDIFLGEVPISPYETPGNQNFAETILPFVHKTDIIVLSNHGTVSFGVDVERAFWLTEILESYCRILMLAKQLGGIQHVSAVKVKELLDLRMAWGFNDPKHEMDLTPEQTCDPVNFGSTWEGSRLSQRAFKSHPESTAANKKSQPNKRNSVQQVELSEKAMEDLATRIASKLRKS